MKIIKITVVLITLVLIIGIYKFNFSEVSKTKITQLDTKISKGEITHINNCPGKFFDKSAIVFNVLSICATSEVSQDKLQHTANVAAQWLDNNQNGITDNPEVDAKLKANKATIVMSGESFGSLENQVFEALNQENRFGQDLHAIETNNPSRRDATQEEVHHIIVGAGWASAYPDLFNDMSQSSAIYKAWQAADAKKYYQYDDPTCDNKCKTMEFVYKSTAAYLGSSVDLADTEFTIKNQSDLRKKLPMIVKIYESETYNYPTLTWPDGVYEHAQNIVYLK